VKVAKGLSKINCTVEHVPSSSVFLAYLFSFVVGSLVFEFVLDASIVGNSNRWSAIISRTDNHNLGNKFSFKVSSLSRDPSFCTSSLILDAAHGEASRGVMFAF
jgi:hypothetical protein